MWTVERGLASRWEKRNVEWNGGAAEFSEECSVQCTQGNPEEEEGVETAVGLRGRDCWWSGRAVKAGCCHAPRCRSCSLDVPVK